MKNVKKLLGVFFVALTAVFLVSCKKSEFKHDGDFTGYVVNGTNFTTVTVTIEKGKIKSYYIDVLQGKVTVDEETGNATFAWNEKTKKELKEEYGMKKLGPKYELNKKTNKWELVEGKKSEIEWFEQAELIEAYWLKKGLKKGKVRTKLVEGRFVDIAGVTIKDSDYSLAANKALELARSGKYQGVVVNGTNVTSVVITKNNDQIESFYIDVLQGKASKDKETGKGVLVWNEKTKKELKEDYGMKNTGPKYELNKETNKWELVEGKKSEIEWFEQAELIEAYWLEKGLKDGKVQSNLVDGRFSDITGVTIKDGDYSVAANKAIAAALIK